MLLYSEFNDYILSYLTPEQCQRVRKAYLVAETAHQTQHRYSGEPYIIHPLEVANILAKFHLDDETLQAALLHDVLEDTNMTKEELSSFFGEKVAHLVDGVSKLKQIKFPSRAHEQAENLRKMMFAVAHDIRVLLIKLADRLHNMRTLGGLPTEKKYRKARETLEIYAPIAYRLGMNILKKEFEDLGFKSLYPLRYAVLENAILNTRSQRQNILDDIHSTLEHALKTAGVTFHQVALRQKRPYAVYRKMRRNQQRFKDLPELFGFRIVVYSQQDCYRVLGVLHNLFKPMLGKFKDYIAIPKANGYQSLHTTLIVKNYMMMEFQVRSLVMHQASEFGIASYWMQHREQLPSNHLQHTAQQWVKNMIELETTSHSSLEFIEHMKMDLDPDEVYVFDEKGEIWTLPKGSTPIDLAYARSPTEARHCVACSVNKLLMPLSTALQSGQTVKLIYSPHAAPNAGWLTFAITGKARSYIRNWLRNQQYQHAVELGKRLICKDLEVYKLSLDDFNQNAINLLPNWQCSHLDDLYAAIGLGKKLAAPVVQAVLRSCSQVQEASLGLPLHINGHEGMVLEYANCCYPIGGDAIVGVIHAGYGLIVHRENCQKLHELPHETFISLAWDTQESVSFQTKIELQLLNQIGVLATIANALSEHQVNIISATTLAPVDTRFNDLELIITVTDRTHLATILKRLRRLPVVRRIKRF